MKDGQSDNRQNKVKQIFGAAQELSADERAELVSLLTTLKSGSNLFVGVGTTQLSAQTACQIDMNSKDEFAQILEAVADKMQEQP